MSPGDTIAEQRPAWLIRQGWFWMTIDLLLVLTAVGAVLFASTWPPIVGYLPIAQLDLLLALASAGLAAGAALVAALTAKMSAPSLVRGFAAPLACYAVVVMPLSVMHATPTLAGIRAAALTANVCFVVMLLLALLARRPRWLATWRVLLIAMVVTSFAGLLAGWLPGYHRLFAGSVVLPQRFVLLGWCVVAALFMARGALAKQSTTWRVGLAFAVLAIAHLILIGQRPGTLPFASLRALGLLVLAIVLVLHARDVARVVLRGRETEASRRRAEEVASAERDHEMRNVLAGLSGAAHVLSSGGEAVPELGGAVHRELERLRSLLEPTAECAEPDDDCPALEDELRRLVMLGRVGGARLELDCEQGLLVEVPTAVLAQVVSNLLVNCQRHAPGAPVRVTAKAEEDHVVISVADRGPGFSGDLPAREGGIGVPVSTRLLAEHGGSLAFGSGEGGVGCVAVVSVPAVRPRQLPEPQHVTREQRPVVGIS